MQQAYLLPLPKFTGTGQMDALEDHERHVLEWRRALGRLYSDKSVWSKIHRQLQQMPSHPLGISTDRGDNLLHLAVIDDQCEVLQLLKNDSTLTRKQNHMGLTPLELALFLHKKKSAAALFSVQTPAFLNQPKVEFEEPDKIAALDLEYLPQPIFASHQVMEEIVNHTLQAKQQDAIPQDRIWMGVYYDMEIQERIHPKLAVQWIDSEIQFGLFAKEKIWPCSFVGEYTGLIQERQTKHRRESEYCYRYTTWPMGPKTYVIDAENMGNATRFINHSDTPNLALACVYWRSLPRLLLISLREISEGEQLFFDYGKIYWKQLATRTKRTL